MATSVQAITLSSVADGSGAFVVSGVIGGQYPHLLGGNEDHIFQVPIAIPGPDRIFLTEFPNAAATDNVAFGAFEWVQG